MYRERIRQLAEKVCAAEPRTLLAYGALFLTTIAVLIGTYISSAPTTFPRNGIVVIPTDSSGAEFAETLKDAHVIRSRLVFRILARVTGLDRSLDPGAYVFRNPMPVSGIVWRIAHAEHGIDPVRITFTEGMTTNDMARELTEELPGFNTEAFLQEASTSEGYLFPDTYLFTPGADAHDLVIQLRSEFGTKITGIMAEVLSFGKPVEDDVKMASILEREARGLPEKRMVAGILWNRIRMGMPLQVDAVFGYIHDKNGYTPTAEDLDSESLYNTYRNRGLPPTPIDNPGLDSLLAAVTPTKTEYLYYLTGTDGNMYYAKTFEQHKKNKALYLK